MSQRGIILIGLRGSGKSSVGKLLASRLQGTFVDLDDETPREMGCRSVAEAWVKEGEPGFRAAEVRALERVLRARPRVLALGGGTPTAPGAAAMLRAHREATGAILLYLHAAPEVLRGRLAGADNAHRPALMPGGGGTLDEVDRVYAARDAAYRALADRVVETAGHDANEIAVQLEQTLNMGRRPVTG